MNNDLNNALFELDDLHSFRGSGFGKSCSECGLSYETWLAAMSLMLCPANPITRYIPIAAEETKHVRMIVLTEETT